MAKPKRIPQARNIKLNDDGTLSPVDSTKPSSLHTGLPHPLKCSKCDYVAPGVKESKEHWFDEHTA